MKEKKRESGARALAAGVESEAERRRTARLPFELQWRLNTNYLLGNQHCDINVHRMTVENYRPLYDYMSNEVFNRIGPIMETRRAHLQTLRCDLTVLPKSPSGEDCAKADAATALLRNLQRSGEYRACFERAIGLCELCGNAFWLCWYDEKEKKPAMTVLSPYEVLPEDPYVESLTDQNSVILEQVRTKGEIYELYGISVDEEKVRTLCVTPRAGAGGFGYESAASSFEPGEREGVVLRTYMEKPNGRNPQGKMVVTAGGEVLFEGTLPSGYPLCHLKSRSVTGQFFGKSVIETLIPLQRSYNGIKNRINDFINRSTCGQLLIEDGSVDADDLTEKGLVPGEPVIYRRGASLPKLLEEPVLSDMAMAQCRQLAEDMEYAAGVSGLLTGSALPGGVSSGSAIEELRNIDTVRLSLYADNLRRGVRELCSMWLALYALSLDGRREELLCPADLDARELVFVTENELAMSEEEKRRQCAEALKLGLFSDAEGRVPEWTKKKLLRRLLGGEAAGESEEEAQQRNAEKENRAFSLGLVPARLPIDDDAIHLKAHRLCALSEQFYGLLAANDPRAKALLAHIREHSARLEAERKK